MNFFTLSVFEFFALHLFTKNDAKDFFLQELIQLFGRLLRTIWELSVIWFNP